MRFKALFLFSFLLLSACGWHLRGITPCHLNTACFMCKTKQGQFDRQLNLQMTFNDVVLAKEAADAQATLSIAHLK